MNIRIGMTIQVLTLSGAAMMASNPGAAQDAVPTSNGWLDAQELGASGSQFESKAATTDGSNRIAIENVGDFKAGQGVTISKCNIQCTTRLYGPGDPYGPGGAARDAKDAVEIRGYDGTAGGWLVYILEIDGANPTTFRWSDNLVRGNQWRGTRVPVAADWQKLSNGIEVKLGKRDWQPGEFVSFTARDQRLTTIEKIEGNTLVLKHPANRTVVDAVVRHSDTAALQAAIDRAIRERKNLSIPAGYYRLRSSLLVRNPEGLLIEGADGVNTVLDISEGAGACFSLQGGTEVTIRNVRLLGHTGMEEQAGYFTSSSGFSFWACALKPCNGVGIGGTERVLVENVHASRMASECFISGGPYRKGQEEPAKYTKSLTFLRCSVTDCAANAFNNCDFAESTSILYCRVDGAGWHMYEGSGRFIKIVGNYIRNAGPITIGDIPHNLPRTGLRHLEDLGAGQAVVTDNVLEGIGRCGGIAINHGPTQVIVANNLFINYNGTAINASSNTVHWSFPPQNIIITGNIIDLTCTDDKPRWRSGISVSTSDTTVSDNQVYVRGACAPNVTGLRIGESAQNLNIHDNLVRNCSTGLSAHRLEGRVVKVTDPSRFTVEGIPYPWRYSGFYKGWNLVWLGEGKPRIPCLADVFDNDTLEFRLAQPCEGMQPGDKFNLYPPAANWQIHGNTITGCQTPVLLDAHGSPTSRVRDNLISRGEATGVKQAVDVRGQFDLTGNHISGFDEPGAVALSLGPDNLGRAWPNLIRDNVFQRCTATVREARPGLWQTCVAQRNVFLDSPEPPAPAPPPAK